MKFKQWFPLIAARRSAYRASLLVVAGLLLSGVATSAPNNGSKFSAPSTPSAPPRPVARLITASPRTETATRQRPRFVGTGQTVPSAVVMGAINVAAAPVAALVAATSDEQRVVDLINVERRKMGAKPLALDGKLLRLARLHSENMARQDFFAHVGRDGLDALGRVEAAGIRDWRSLAENIAYNHERFPDPLSQVVGRWMQSNKHRHNILNSDFTHTGLGIARADDGRIFFTQVFMTR